LLGCHKRGSYFVSIIDDNLDRLVDTGLIDVNEAKVFFGSDDVAEANQESPLPVGQFWVASNMTEKLAVGVPRAKLEGGKWCFAKYMDGGHAKFVLRRGEIGKIACIRKLDDCIQSCIRAARRNYMTAVPQFYFDNAVIPANYAGTGASIHVFVGRLQLLLPVFSLSGQVVAALTTAINRNTNPQAPAGFQYLASTILPLSWALCNARLLTTPQASWIWAGQNDDL
jgi:hypothetical protein